MSLSNEAQSLESLTRADEVFARLNQSTNRFVSSDGDEDDRKTYAYIRENEQSLNVLFNLLGFQLFGGNGYYCLFRKDENTKYKIELKMEALIKAVERLRLFMKFLPNFSVGLVFTKNEFAAQCQNSIEAKEALEKIKDRKTDEDRVESLLKNMTSAGYFLEVDPNRKEYRVLCAIKYLEEISDKIEILNSNKNEKE